jgi:hypothetical protein
MAAAERSPERICAASAALSGQRGAWRLQDSTSKTGLM